MNKYSKSRKTFETKWSKEFISASMLVSIDSFVKSLKSRKFMKCKVQIPFKLTIFTNYKSCSTQLGIADQFRGSRNVSPIWLEN